MTKTKSIYLALLAVLLSPMVANASLIKYEFTGSGGDFTVNGEVVLDEADAVASANLVDFFTSWFFTWTDGSIVGSSTSSDSIFRETDSFEIDGFGAVSFVNLCTNNCSPGNLTDIFVSLTEFSASLPFSEISAVGGSGEWSAAQSVPEPGTLALLGLGLVGMAARRRRTV